MISRIHLNLPNAYKLMCFDRNINGNMDVKLLIAIIGHCTDQRKLLYERNTLLKRTPNKFQTAVAQKILIM